MEIYNLIGAILQQLGVDYKLLEILNIIIVIVLGIGSIIYAVINLIQQKSKIAKNEAIQQTNKEIEQIHIEMNTLNDRMDEMDKWRKEMNGQLKIMNERQKFTNQILEEQKNSLVLVSQSLNALATNVAVMNETLKNHIEKHT